MCFVEKCLSLFLSKHTDVQSGAVDKPGEQGVVRDWYDAVIEALVEKGCANPVEGRLGWKLKALPRGLWQLGWGTVACCVIVVQNMLLTRQE